MSSIKCTKINLLHAYLQSFTNVTESAINDANRYKFESGLIVDVFHSGSIRFQNEIKDPELKGMILAHIESLNCK